MKEAALTKKLAMLQNLSNSGAPTLPAHLLKLHGEVSAALSEESVDVGEDDDEPLCSRSFLESSRARLAVAYCVLRFGEGDFRKVLDFCEGLEAEERRSLKRYEAYAFYRLGDYEGCARLAEQDVGGDDVEFFSHLMAQSEYRMGKYAKARALYGELMDMDPHDSETVANFVAAAVNDEVPLSVAEKEQAASLAATNEDYDLMVNLALSEPSLASKCAKLDKAETYANDTLSSEELTEELGRIQAMRGAVLTAHGHPYDVPAKDAHMSVVLLNNSSSPDPDKLQAALTSAGDTLTALQRDVISSNIRLLRQLTSPFDSLPDTAERAVRVALAPTLAQKKSLAQPDPILLAQVCLSSGDYEGAADALESLPSSQKSSPAFVKTLSDIYSLTESRADKASTLFDESMSSLSGEQRFKLGIAKAKYHVSTGDYETAAALIRSLPPDAPDEYSRTVATAVLIQALSHFDVDAAEGLASQIPQIDETGFDIDSLEWGDLPRSARVDSSSALLAVNMDVERAQKKKRSKALRLAQRAKKREKYLAKLEAEGKYDPSRPIQPDPERWLPKSQRSYSKKGRKNRNKFSGAQGAGAGGMKDAAKLDVAARLAEGPIDNGKSTAHLSTGGKRSKGSRRK